MKICNFFGKMPYSILLADFEWEFPRDLPQKTILKACPRLGSLAVVHFLEPTEAVWVLGHA